MTENQNQEPQSLNIDDLQMYVVIGVDKDGKPITASSQGLTLPDMGMLLGRALTDLMLHVSGAGSFDAMHKFQAAVQKARQGGIVTPR